MKGWLPFSLDLHGCTSNDLTTHTSESHRFEMNLTRRGHAELESPAQTQQDRHAYAREGRHEANHGTIRAGQ